MVVENTRENQRIADVAATMAIEDMYVDNDFIKEMMKVAQGEKTYEEVRQEAIKQYAG